MQQQAVAPTISAGIWIAKRSATGRLLAGIVEASGFVRSTVTQQDRAGGARKVRVRTVFRRRNPRRHHRHRQDRH